MLVQLLAFVLIAATSDEAKESRRFPPPEGPAAEAIRILTHAVEDDDGRSAAIARAIELLGQASPAGQNLTSIGGDEEAVDKVRQSVEMLSFEPIQEAELPKGFPTFTPVGAIEVKQYPKHRRAEAGDFFTLFRHITSRKIAMTAPVRMAFDHDEGDLSQQSMAFFYGDQEIGKTGADGRVAIRDEEQQTVVALGCRGEQTEERLQEGRERLLEWLRANPKYHPAGDLVVMGYNSPMIPRDKNFFEVQMPVAVAEGEPQKTP